MVKNEIDTVLAGSLKLAIKQPIEKITIKRLQ